MVRKGKFIIGKSKSSTLSLEQRILGYNRQLTKLNTKVELISAWISKKFGVSFLVEASVRVELKDLSKHLSLLKPTAPHSSNPGLKKAKQTPQRTSCGQHSGSESSNVSASDVIVGSDSDVNEGDKEAEITVREPAADRAPLEDVEPGRERHIPQQRKSKVQRNKMASFRVGANNGQQEVKGTKEQQPRQTLAKRNFQAPDKARHKHSCNWPNCNKHFSNNSAFVIHQRTHTGEKPFKCTWPKCGKSFSSSADRTRHRRTHTGEKPFACNWPNCDNSFAVRSSLKTHRRVHTGEKPFACNWPNCDKSFTQSCNLQLHTSTHTGERPFKCGFCDYRCASSSDMSAHIKIHTGEKPYKCHVCAATFTQSSNTIQHEKLHHRSH